PILDAGPGEHPNSTLFPYTTLFRSGVRVRLFEPGDNNFVHPVAGLGIHQFTEHCTCRLQVAAKPEHGGGDRPCLAAGEADDADADRKSTRLNSSHSQISYAVFCLKK